MVSVVMALYNYAKYVGDAIKSVQKQTYSDWELVIVDDASTDNPMKVLSPLLKADSRISYYALPVNSGPSAARNEAIRRSKGNFITFLDADDMLTKESLEARLNKFRDDTLWVHGRAMHLRDGKLMPDTEFHGFQKKYSRLEVKPLDYSRGIHSNSVLVRRKFYEELGLFDEDLRYGEEQDMWKRALAFGHMPRYTKKFVCIYRYHKGQTRFQPGAQDLKKRCFKLSAKRLKVRLEEGINTSNTICLGE